LIEDAEEDAMGLTSRLLPAFLVISRLLASEKKRKRERERERGREREYEINDTSICIETIL